MVDPTLGVITLDDHNDYLMYRSGSGNTVEIYDILVTSERRKGKGRQLVNLLLTKYMPAGCTKVWAITRASNFIAHQFYEELGFRVLAPLRDFYGLKDSEGKDTVDAIMYGRDLTWE